MAEERQFQKKFLGSLLAKRKKLLDMELYKFNPNQMNYQKVKVLENNGKDQFLQNILLVIDLRRVALLIFSQAQQIHLLQNFS
jgi:hypothetical protein